jgi:transposase-like protein
MDPLFPSTEAEEPITVTPGEIIAHRRRRLLELADELGNVSEACRIMGVSRTRFYEWRNVAQEYGLEALVPKERRAPQMPNATPTWVVNERRKLLEHARSRCRVGQMPVLECQVPGDFQYRH